MAKNTKNLNKSSKKTASERFKEINENIVSTSRKIKQIGRTAEGKILGKPKYVEWPEDKILINFKLAIGFYAFITLLALVGTILLFTFGTKVHNVVKFGEHGPAQLRYFTNLSGICMFFDGLAMTICFCLAIKNHQRYIPRFWRIFNLICTTNTSLTMVVTVLVLAPAIVLVPSFGTLTDTTLTSLFSSSNLLFHLIIPVLTIFTYLFFAKQGPIKFRDSWFCWIPVLSYMVFYIVAAYTHRSDNGFQEGYDWYMFCHFGAASIVPSLIVIPLFFWAVSLGLRAGNRKISSSKKYINIVIQSIILVLIIAGSAMQRTEVLENTLAPISIMPETCAQTFSHFCNLMTWIYGIGTIIYIVYLSLQAANKINSIPKWVSIYRLISTANLAFVLVIVLFLFAPWSTRKFGYFVTWDLLFYHRTILFHLIIPVMAIGSYVLVEHNNLKFWFTSLACAPIFIYTLGYTINVYVNNGLNDSDWYYLYELFTKNGAWIMPILAPTITFGLSYAIWFGNNKINLQEIKLNKKSNLVAVKQPKFASILVEELESNN